MVKGNLFLPSDLDQLLLTMQTFFSFLSKQATLMRRSTVLSLPWTKYAILQYTLDKVVLATAVTKQL